MEKAALLQTLVQQLHNYSTKNFEHFKTDMKENYVMENIFSFRSSGPISAKVFNLLSNKSTK